MSYSISYLRALAFNNSCINHIYIGHYIHIHIYHNTIIYISLIHIINLCYLSSYSTLLNIGLNRLGNLCFDNSLFYLLWSIFFINLIILNLIFLINIFLIGLLLIFLLILRLSILILIIGTIYFILLDELIMGNTQRRKGPFNLGGYGILSSIINGFNLIISQFLIPKLYIHYWFQIFPIAFLLFSLAIYNVIFPFLFIDLYLSFIILLLLSGLSIILLFLLSYTGLSK